MTVTVGTIEEMRDIQPDHWLGDCKNELLNDSLAVP
jgi:hypothetical protein